MRATITMPIATLAFIIAKARATESDTDDDPELDDDDEEEPEEEKEELVLADEGETEPESEDDELTELLGSLHDDELVELLALMWIGSGEAEGESWGEVMSRARAVGGPDVLSHLLNADDLGDLIEDALADLGYEIVIAADELAS